MRSFLKIFSPALLALSLLASCSPPRKVAVEERKTITVREEAERLGGTHIRIVQPGDTLYGIAFANGLDAKKLAAWNRVNDTSKLRVGQRIRLTRPIGFVEQRPANKATAKTGTAKTSPQSKPKSRPAPATPAAKSSKTLAWRWPTSGGVTARFNVSSGQQGITVSGKQGQTIVAAHAGEVVYVGNGLKGYGNLVILKHDQDFLSAYAHNLETFVTEGQQLKAGQRLATMGLLRGSPALHFQIRKHGEPVDPLRFLPKR